LPHPALSPRPVTRAALELGPKALWFIALGGLLFGLAWIVPPGLAALVITVLGATFIALAVLVKGLVLRHGRAHAGLHDTIAEFVALDPAPIFTTNRDGEIVYANQSARDRFGRAHAGGTLAAAFADHFAAPATVIYRLQNKALARGASREDLVVRQGHMRLSVHRVGEDGFLWRCEEIAERAAADGSGEAVALPMMTVSKNGTILFMNEVLRRLLGGRETTLDRVFADLPLRPGETHRISAAHGSINALVIEAPLTAGRREIYLVPDARQHRVGPGEWGVLESLPVPLLRLDREGAITMATARARHLLGDDAAIGSHLSDQLEGLGRPLSDWLREAWEGRHLGRVETMRATKAEERFLQVSLEQFHDETGPALVAVLNDATELKSLETQFVQSQKMEAIGQLAGGVAHDFNNLLTAISGHCDLLLLRHDAGDPDFADLSQISQNSNRAAALVSQLLAFSRKQTLRLERLDLADTMGDLTHLLGRLVGERVQLSFEPGHPILPVRADKRQLEQVLMNLVVNARDAMMPAGGKIRLVLENHFLDHPLERDRAIVPAGDYVTIKVIDEGRGISPEHRDKIFEPFFTTKGAGKGTGLGLSMVYGIVKQSGAFVFVDSIEGAGTTFTLYFPVCRSDLAAEQMPAATPPPPSPLWAPGAEAGAATGAEPRPGAETGATGPGLPSPTHAVPPREGGIVLLVEDEAPVRAFASRALQLRGFTVLEAENAEEALKTLEDESLEVDVFVTDVVMPGMDGPTWVSEALRARPGVRVVFVSGYAEDSVSEHQNRIPNSVFLPKPFSLSELTDTVSRQLH
jgi:two-component system, cell cycle sensor histidine kinase and response regulator CckA